MQSVLVVGVSQTSLGINYRSYETLTKEEFQVAEDTETQSEWITFFPKIGLKGRVVTNLLSTS